jgi:GNAT superfamily N-acetyltransferase
VPLLPGYHVRAATLADVDVLARQRSAMFTDMGVAHDVLGLDAEFRRWLADSMPSGIYRAWLIDTPADTVAAGGGITVLPWPPGPQHPGGRVAFVYNVYTEPSHRRRGLARVVMETIHDWCRKAGVSSLALNASEFGRSLYESMGYRVSPSPTMFLVLK